jgi:hypothetical protein
MLESDEGASEMFLLPAVSHMMHGVVRACMGSQAHPNPLIKQRPYFLVGPHRDQYTYLACGI